MGLFALLVSACGNQPQNPAAFNYGYGVNGAQTGYYGYNGYNGYNNGYGGWYSQPMALAGSVYTRSYQVGAGQQVYLSANLRWGAYIKCDRKLINSYDMKDGGIVPANIVSATFNGQAIPATSGVYTAPAAGTITVTADLSSLAGTLKCGWSGDRPYQILQYWVQQL